MPETTTIRRFDDPDETREMERGTFQLVEIGGVTVGRAAYEPGWRWSEHVGAALGKASCDVEHVGLVISGRNRITMDDGRIIDVGPGDLFAIGPGHDSEVVGDEPYVSLHFLGAGAYART
jgi:mannose-6-phosphate isomerase-like protein (cupin superfamily)